LAKRDYYEVLGITRDAENGDIKKAYRKLAVQYHPDRNPGDKTAEDHFKEATEAYEILINPEKRRAYDQFGFAGVEGMGGGGAQDFSSVFRDFEDIFGDFSGIFDSFFGGGRRSGRSRSVRGSDLRYDLDISFEDAVFGKKVELTYDRNVHCDECNGTGSQSGEGKKVCSTCGGAGQVRRSSGFFSIAQTCPVCGGEGSVIENPCRNCRGTGLLKKKQTVKVTVPPGIDSGKRISIRGQGDAGPQGAPTGDLYVYIRVRPHEFFQRDGSDVYCVLPISMTQAALGAHLKIPTVDKKTASLKIHSGTQNGELVKIKGNGMPILNNPSKKGDMYVKVNVRIPKKLSGKEKNILQEFAELEGATAEPRPIPLSEISS
jgi:molecular chaperone DnaJ